MRASLSESLREGYGEVAAALPEEAVALLLRARDSISAGERSRCLAGVVHAYRCGPRQLWGPVLLDLMAPAIVERLQRLHVQPPAIDEEEVRQQFLVEVLHAAAYIPIPRHPSWVRGQILSRANQAVRRWLARERRRQGRQESFEAREEWWS
jgi:hypothetical protein